MRGHTRIAVTLLSLLLLLSSLAGCSRGFLRGYAEAPSAAMVERSEVDGAPSGILRFAFDDLGALNTDATETHAIPWKVLVAALLLDRRSRGEPVALREDAVFPILQDFGFIVPEMILNLDAAVRPGRYTGPIGLNRGVASRALPRVEVEIANLGCAACHAGVTYDTSGMPTRDVWLGLPNTSLDLDGLTRSLYEGLRGAVNEPGHFRATLDSIYPEMAPGERATLEKHILPTLAARIPRARDEWGALTPYAPGGPGAANGVGAVKHVLGLVGEGEGIVGVGGAVSTPDLGDRLLKSSFASDGSFGVPGARRSEVLGPDDLDAARLDGQAGVVAFFAVSTMGVRPDRVGEILPRIREVVEFLRDYRPPPFPGSVDRALAARGEAVFAARCSVCHGRYSAGPQPRLVAYPNVVIPAAEIGTDPVRWASATAEFARAIQESEAGRFLALGPTAGYVPPPLTGLWATAPYFHNGSVPTVWHLLHPEERPERFEVGGHRLDFEKLGIAGESQADGSVRHPAGYVPWSRPTIYDTRLPGQSNTGHEAPLRGLTEEEKLAVLEYLKLL